MNRIGKSKLKNSESREKKSKLTKKQKIIILMSIIGVIVAVFGVVLGTYIYKADGNIADATLSMVADVVGDETPITALIMGVSTDINSELTDTIILVGYNPKTQASFMLSIPRDTFVGTNEASANGYDKINALYQKNVKKTISAVEKLTGVKVDYYVVVKTQALIDVVDAIGGVEFDVPIDMKYDDPTQDLHIDLKKGVQILDGDKAEQLLRYRHSNPDKNGKMTTYPASYGSDDFGRMRTQREFIVATANQLVSWKNVSKLKSILNAVFSNLETNMSLSKMIGYIPSALKLNTEAIRAEQLPGESALINNLWFYRADSSKTKELVTELMGSLELSEKEYKKKYSEITTKSTNKKVDDKSIKDNSSLTTNTVKEENENKTTVVNPTTCNHDWKLVINLEPTCANSGARNYRCSKCGEEKSEVIPATGAHVWVEMNRVSPTETSEGKITSRCEICGNIVEKVLDKLPAKVQKDEEKQKSAQEQQKQNTVTPNTPEQPEQPVQDTNTIVPEQPVQDTNTTVPEQPAQDTNTVIPELTPAPIKTDEDVVNDNPVENPNEKKEEV